MSEKDYLRESLARGLVVQYNRAIADAIAVVDRLDAERKLSGIGSFHLRPALNALFQTYTPAPGIEAEGRDAEGGSIRSEAEDESPTAEGGAP